VPLLSLSLRGGRRTDVALDLWILGFGASFGFGVWGLVIPQRMAWVLVLSLASTRLLLCWHLNKKCPAVRHFRANLSLKWPAVGIVSKLFEYLHE
jgi:hypothetical protein